MKLKANPCFNLSIRHVYEFCYNDSLMKKWRSYDAYFTMPKPILTIITKIRASVLFTQDTSSAKMVKAGSAN